MKKTPSYSELTEDQCDAALAFAGSRGLAIEATSDPGTGEYSIRILPTDPGAPEWTDELISELEAILA